MASTVTNNQIFSVLTDVKVALARVEGRVMNLEESNTDLMKVVIKGNGKLPLTERVQKLEDKNCIEEEIKAVEDAKKSQAVKDAKENKSKWGARVWAVIMLFVAQLVIWLFLFLRTLPA